MARPAQRSRSSQVRTNARQERGCLLAHRGAALWWLMGLLGDGAAPSIDSLTPSLGASAGGTLITLHSSSSATLLHQLDVTEVRMGTLVLVASAYTASSTTQLVLQSPAAVAVLSTTSGSTQIQFSSRSMGWSNLVTYAYLPRTTPLR